MRRYYNRSFRVVLIFLTFVYSFINIIFIQDVYIANAESNISNATSDFYMNDSSAEENELDNTEPNSEIKHTTVFWITILEGIILGFIFFIIIRYIANKYESELKKQRNKANQLMQKLFLSEEEVEKLNIKCSDLEEWKNEKLSYFNNDLKRTIDKYSTLKENYDKLEEDYNALKQEHQNALMEVKEYRKKFMLINQKYANIADELDLIIAREFDGKFSNLVDCESSSQIIDEINACLSSFEELTPKQKELIKTDITSLREKLKVCMQIRDKEKVEYIQKRIAEIVNSISRGTVDNYGILRNADELYNKEISNTGLDIYFDNTIRVKLKQLFKEACISLELDRRKKQEEKLYNEIK